MQVQFYFKNKLRLTALIMTDDRLDLSSGK